MEKEDVRGKQINKKRILLIIFLLILLVSLIILFVESNIYRPNIEEASSQISNINPIDDQNETNDQKNLEVVNIDMPEKIEKYNVIGQLVIEKIEFEKYILHTTDEKSLNLSITRYYGAQPNEIGNCCISGHNTKNAFKKLKELNNGDTFYIIDRKNCEKVIYKIYEIRTISPKDLDCLNQKTDGKREVTLITCTPRWIE